MIRKGPRFTEAARAAAAQKRRERAAMKAETRTSLEVFVLRSEIEAHRYDWEIRQFGGVVVKRSDASFASSAQARVDGTLVLQTLPAEVEDIDPPRVRHMVGTGGAGCETYG